MAQKGRESSAISDMVWRGNRLIVKDGGRNEVANRRLGGVNRMQSGSKSNLKIAGRAVSDTSLTDDFWIGKRHALRQLCYEVSPRLSGGSLEGGVAHLAYR